MIICAACSCAHHPGQICAEANADDQADGAACWCEQSLPVKVFFSNEAALEAIVEDLRASL